MNRVDLGKLDSKPKCGSCSRPLLLDRPIKATAADFDTTIATASVPVLVDFYADWCGPCRVMAPVLDDLASRRAGEILVLKVDTDHDPQISERFGIQGIPTLVAFRHGAETGRLVGIGNLEEVARLVA